MTPEIVKALREPFPPEQVGKLPKGGVTLDYVGHGAVTDRLLSIDPEWSWEPLSVNEHGLPRLDEDGNLWIKLTVCGVTRLGVGDGPTMKVLIGDALRNAAMRFGVALDLWIRGHAEDDEKVTQNQPARRRQEPTEPLADHGTHEAIRSMVANLPDDLREQFIDWYVAGGFPPIQKADRLTQAQAEAVCDQIDKLDPSPGPVTIPASNSPADAIRQEHLAGKA